MGNQNWHSAGRDKNAMTVAERFGELVGIVVVSLVAVFFAYHLSMNTGFMTTSFGLTGIVLLFGSAAMSIISTGARAITGRRDKSRPFELAAAVYWVIASIWFLSVLPFNFSHLSDPLPDNLRFFLSWVSNGIGWLILLLTTLGSIAAALITTAKMVQDRTNNRHGNVGGVN